jgi:hypothetical protein
MFRITGVLVLVSMLVPQASAHDALGASDWIGANPGKYKSVTGNIECCGKGDCGRLDDDAVRYGKAGVEVHGTATFFIGRDPNSWMRLRIDEVIPYNEVQPSEDGKFWRCQWPGPQQTGGVMYGTTPHRTCFFGPPPGS